MTWYARLESNQLSARYKLAAVTVWPLAPVGVGIRPPGRRGLSSPHLQVRYTPMERTRGFEPRHAAWKAAALPLRNIRLWHPWQDSNPRRRLRSVVLCPTELQRPGIRGATRTPCADLRRIGSDPDGADGWLARWRAGVGAEGIEPRSPNGRRFYRPGAPTNRACSDDLVGQVGVEATSRRGSGSLVCDPGFEPGLRASKARALPLRQSQLRVRGSSGRTRTFTRSLTGSCATVTRLS